MIVPTNGNSDASVAQPTSIGSSIRRRASANVQKTSAAQTTISTRMRTLTAVLSASLSMPKTPKVSMRLEPYPRRRTPRGTSARKRSRGRRRRGSSGRPRRRRGRSSRARSGRGRSQRRGPPRTRLGEEVGDQIDRAGDDHGAVRAGELARQRQRRARLGDDLRLGTQLLRQRRKRRGRQRAEVRRRGADERVAARAQRGKHRGGVLVVEDRYDADERALGDPRHDVRIESAEPLARGGPREREVVTLIAGQGGADGPRLVARRAREH